MANGITFEAEFVNISETVNVEGDDPNIYSPMIKSDE